MTNTVTPTERAPTYRGWSITWDYGHFTATSPNYDASYEGPEDGWVDNGQRVTARTKEGVQSEVDGWIESQLFEALEAIVNSGVALTQSQRINALAALNAAQVSA